MIYEVHGLVHKKPVSTIQQVLMSKMHKAQLEIQKKMFAFKISTLSFANKWNVTKINVTNKQYFPDE